MSTSLRVARPFISIVTFTGMRTSLPNFQVLFRNVSTITTTRDTTGSYRTSCTISHSTRSVGSVTPDTNANARLPPRSPSPVTDMGENSDVASMLQFVLNLDSVEKAERLLLKYNQFQNKTPDDIRASYRFLQENGLNWGHLQRISWVLAIDPGTMTQKATLLKFQMNIKEFKISVPFLNLSSARITRIASIWKAEIKDLETAKKSELKGKGFGNRIEIIASWLKCDHYEVAVMMGRTSALMSSSLSSIQAKITCMLDYGIAAEDIINDPYIFTNQLEKIELKLQKCEVHGILPVKPWVLRCAPYIFQTHMQRMTEERELMKGHQDITSFLMESLQCTSSEVAELIKRAPFVKYATAMKLNEMIQFLLSQGFTIPQIFRLPRVLLYSVASVGNRLSELASRGYVPTSIAVLCYKAHQFDRFLLKLDKRVKKSD